MFIWHLKIVSEESFLIFCSFFFLIGPFVFFKLNFQSSYYSLCKSFIRHTQLENIFFQPIICVSIFFQFLWQTCKVLNEVHFVIFLPWVKLLMFVMVSLIIF